MHRLLALVLATAPLLASAGEVRVLLLNDTNNDIAVETSGQTVQAEVRPREGKLVSLQISQRLRFGQATYEYRMSGLEALARADAAPVVLQANSNRALYVMPKGTRSPRLSLPPQPTGFPLKPTRRADPE